MGQGIRAATAPHPAATESARRQVRSCSYPGRADQVGEARAWLREVLAGRPRLDDAVLVGSELAGNAVRHSRSGLPGGVFTVWAGVLDEAETYVAASDAGGIWDSDLAEVERARGLDVVQALAGPANWGINSGPAGRLVWARLLWPGAGQMGRDHGDSEDTMPGCPADADAAADLEQLAAELRACGFVAQLVTPAARLPYLDVHPREAPVLAERIYAQADWFFWPTIERIAARDDPAAAASTIVRTLRPAEGEPGA